MQQQTLLKAVANAVNGILFFFKKERNAKIQMAIAITTVLISVCLGVNKGEWMVILLCIALVIGLEMLNSAIEKLCDAVHPEVHPFIKQTKDIAAGAVLFACLISAIIGIIIFLPKLF
ncbi:MAG: diacylglycerol kinase [Chitinophaga sp.]|nr:diacylglycerol kinase [Chitinophaga sp.]